MDKRTFIKSSTSLAIASYIFPKELFGLNLENKTFELPELPYTYHALEPAIDKLTMEIHYSRHHKAYVDGLNKALLSQNISFQSINDILANVSTLPIAFRNHGGGHFNHSFFWNILTAPNTSVCSGAIHEAITKKWGSLESFKEEFTKTAISRFGSGWAWLILDTQRQLSIVSTSNQDNPLMDLAESKGTPLLALDVWEHAYYLKYQNKRADYIAAFWTIINWNKVNQLYTSSK